MKRIAAIVIPAQTIWCLVYLALAKVINMPLQGWNVVPLFINPVTITATIMVVCEAIKETLKEIE